MDTGKREGDSSSPSDSSIVALQSEGAAGEVVRIDLSDGSSFFLPLSAVESEQYSRGDVLDDERRERLELLSEEFAAYRKGVSLLALREQSRARLEMKLRSRGFATEAVRGAVEKLESSGALDDLRFARVWISARARRNPCGRIKLYAGLLNQGVSRSTAEAALADWSEADEEQALRRAAERILGRYDRTDDRALRALVSKGFSLPVARRALDGADAEW